MSLWLETNFCNQFVVGSAVRQLKLKGLRVLVTLNLYVAGYHSQFVVKSGRWDCHLEGG